MRSCKKEILFFFSTDESEKPEQHEDHHDVWQDSGDPHYNSNFTRWLMIGAVINKQLHLKGPIKGPEMVNIL